MDAFRHTKAARSVSPCRAKPSESADAEDNEGDQDKPLREAKWRLALRRCEFFQGRGLLKELRQKHEEVQVKRGQSGHEIGPMPSPRELAHVKRINRHGQ